MFKERVPGADYSRQIYLTETSEGLELTANDTENETTVILCDDNVHTLRLALQRYERRRK
jgi:hypothetical protein